MSSHIISPVLPQPQQPPPLPPLDPSGGLSSRIRKLRRRFDGHPTYQKPLLKQQSMDEGATVPRGTQITVKVEEVLKVVLLHKGFSSPIFEARASDQPKFDDMEPYNVTDAQAEILWKREAQRLVNAVNQPESSLRFCGQDLLLEGSKDGYTNLSSIAKRIYEASLIWQHDNELLTLIHCKDIHQESRFGEAQGRLSSLDSEATDGSTQAEVPDEKYLRALFALVDYITAVIARLLAQSAHGNSWTNHCLAALISWTTKVKVVSTNLSASARLSLDLAMEKMPRDSKEDKGGLAPGDRTFENLKTSPLSSDDGAGGLKSDAQQVKTLYFLNQALYRANIQDIIKYVLLSFTAGRRPNSGRRITSFELCSVVYETGFAEGFKTLLFQDREGEFLASSDISCLGLAHSAFALLDKTVQDVQRGITQGHLSPGPHLQTMMRWSYQEDPGKSNLPGSLRNSSLSINQSSPPVNPPELAIILKTMEDIVTVMVPLLLTNPFLISELKDFILTASLHSSLTTDHLQLYEESNFKASFCMFTDEFAATVRNDSHISSLRYGLMNRDKLLSGPRVAEISPQGATYQDMSTALGRTDHMATIVKNNAAQIRETNRIMDEWIFDERAVTVKCGIYVWVVTIVAAILVLGGLAVGFVVRNRLLGVDPFNITMYCWVLAAFVILVCKSLRVQDWPWREFLLRRVQCRSVSELQAVTGINAQLILAKLLHDESTTTLSTRGPFNSVFARKADDGFSIDVPLTMWTMLLSGLIMLKVATLQGHALVCLDARRGTKYARIAYEHTPAPLEKEGTHFVCPELPRLSVERPSQPQQPNSVKRKFPLKKEVLGWKRVLGLYNDRDAEFI